MKKNNHSVSVGAVFTGLIFLMNPTVNLYDLLPDVIGCVIIYRALFMLSFVDDRIAAAARCVKILGWLSAAKLAVSAAVLLSGAPSLRRDSDILLFTFLFGAAEIFLLINFVNGFYGGTKYLADRYAGDKTSAEASASRIYMTVYFSVKFVLTLVPEFITLVHPDMVSEFSADHSIRLRQYTFLKNTATLSCAVIMTVFFIYTIFYARKFFRMCEKNEDFNEKLIAVFHENYRSDAASRTKRDLGYTMLLFTVGSFFAADICIDKICFTPTAFFFVFAFAARIALEKVTADHKKKSFPVAFTAVSGVSFAVSAASYVYRFVRIKELSSEFSYKFPLDPLSAVFAAAEQILFVTVVFMFMREFLGIFSDHTGTDTRPEMINVTVCAAITAFMNGINYARPDLGAAFSFMGMAAGAAFFLITLKVSGDLRRGLEES